MRSSTKPNTTTATTKPSLFQRLRGRPARTTTRKTKHSHNPLTGSDTTAVTESTTTHSHTHTRNTRSSGRHQADVAHHHQQRRPSIGYKFSGAMLKLKGSLSGRPGEKAAGTRRMRGTDGRGTRH